MKKDGYRGIIGYFDIVKQENVNGFRGRNWLIFVDIAD